MTTIESCVDVAQQLCSSQVLSRLLDLGDLEVFDRPVADSVLPSP